MVINVKIKTYTMSYYHFARYLCLIFVSKCDISSTMMMETNIV